jgi:hypothetical protein
MSRRRGETGWSAGRFGRLSGREKVAALAETRVLR